MLVTPPTCAEVTRLHVAPAFVERAMPPGVLKFTPPRMIDEGVPAVLASTTSV